MEANALPGADMIILPPGTYILTITGTGEDRATAGDLDIMSNQTIKGAGAASTIIDGGGIDRVLEVHDGGVTAQIDGVTVRNGNSPSNGGGILNSGTLTLNNSSILANSAMGSGGGILNSWILTLNNNSILANSAKEHGGGIANWKTLTLNRSTVSTNSADMGGGILTSAYTRLIINDSTVSANTAASQGGGIRDGGSTTLTNVTVSGNSARLGGGIFSSGSSSEAINVTLNANSAFRGSGIYNSGTISLKNSVVANNIGNNCFDANGRIGSRNHNLDSDGTCKLTRLDDLFAPPLLGSLQNNGGPTRTHALLPGSPAIDAVPLGDCTVNIDQRGVPRPQGVSCDIGAYEAACAPPPNTTMVAWYPFDESAGTLAANLATGNSGTHVGGPTPIPGMVAGALRFDGVGSYVESPSSIVTNVGPASLATSCSGSYSTCPGNLSISTWIRLAPGAERNVMTILDKRAVAGSTLKGYHVFTYAGSFGLQLADGLGSGYSNYLSPVMTPDLMDGDWHHVAVTVRRTEQNGILWYHNGVQVGISNPTGRMGSLANSSPLRIGARTAPPLLSGRFAGDLDELEIYNRALTPQEVESIFNAGSAGKCKAE
jgi:hypothetical protein